MSSLASPSLLPSPGADGKGRLVRVIGRWTLVALVLNGVIGSGIFGLPTNVAKLLGSAAPWAYLLAALAVAAIVAVFAEMASQFDASGGPYLYVRSKLGRVAGIQVGWFTWLTRLTSAAAVANLFVVYLGEFWPAATAPLPRAALLGAIVVLFATVNIRGVKSGAALANGFTVAKLLPLVLFAVVGLWLTRSGISAGAVSASGETVQTTMPLFSAWIDALIALMFAYGGFEAALIPAAEARNPKRDAPFALGIALLTVTLLYAAVHVVAQRALPGLAQSPRPLADAARVFAGDSGATLIALGALLSTFGWLTGAFVTVPRLTFALAERGDFPAFFGRVHARFNTPYVSILAWALIVLLLALYGSFFWNAVLSVGARLVTYLGVCLALLRSRRTPPQGAAWRAPGGVALAWFGIAFCGLLIARLELVHAAIIGGVAVIGAINALALRGPARPTSASDA